MRAENIVGTIVKAKKGRKAQCSRCSSVITTEGGEKMPVVPDGDMFQLMGSCPRCGNVIYFRYNPRRDG